MPLVTTVVAALVGAALFEWLGVPAGALLGAVVGVAGLNLVGTLGPAVELPSVARFVAYAALGWLVGQGVTRETLAVVRDSLLPVTLVIGALLLAGVALGAVLVRFGVMDPATSYLATSPGALTQMVAVSNAVGADATLVTTVHTMRVVILLVLAPLLGRLAGG